MPRPQAGPVRDQLTVVARSAYQEDSTEVPTSFERNTAPRVSHVRRSHASSRVHASLGGDSMRARGSTVPLLCPLAAVAVTGEDRIHGQDT